MHPGATRQIWLYSAVDVDRHVGSPRGFGSPNSPRVCPAPDLPLRQKIVICRDEEGERRRLEPAAAGTATRTNGYV